MRLASIVIAAVLLAAGMVSAEPALIPRPATLTPAEGTFTLGKNSFAHVPARGRELYLSTLSGTAGFPVRLAPADVSCAIQFLGTDSVPEGLPTPAGDGYLLRILPDTVIIHADGGTERFYGLQTLAQLLAGAEKTATTATLPCMTIADAPRFSWRGFMLDESRHFTGVEGVKRLLDTMACYKLNRFHWHLTDSPGWRIEIRKYPKLTTIGSRGSESDRRPDAPRQFYTREQIRDIVAYAGERHITIIPEIDMPGHADAAVRAYPEHDGGGYRSNGEPFKWPRFTFNPAREETLAFLDDVLAEVATLFPDAGVIHFGGDEVHFGWNKWTGLPEVRTLMKREGFTALPEVETWFNRRMAGKINELGFVTGGWDEIAARDLPRDKTLVFWWRHDKPEVLRSTLDAGYKVVLCPRIPTYLDFVQHESHQSGRRWKGAYNTLADTYNFPESLGMPQPRDRPNIRGIQACLWTETTVTQARRDFLTFPRLIALAETAWTDTDRKDYQSFESRLQPHLPRLQARGLGYYDPFLNSPEIKE